jgi:hypothetical protein
VIDVRLGPLDADHAGELLTLQRAAYVSEAQLYDDVRLPALEQSLDELAAEEGTDAGTAALFTGHLSAANLRLYERTGYREQRREVVHPGLTLVHLTKPLR